MPQAKQTPEEIKQAFVSLAFDEAYEIRETLYGDGTDENPGVYARRRANRETLRQLRDQGMLGDEQREELAELYPVREKAEAEAETETETETGAEAA